MQAICLGHHIIAAQPQRACLRAGPAWDSGQAMHAPVPTRGASILRSGPAGGRRAPPGAACFAAPPQRSAAPTCRRLCAPPRAWSPPAPGKGHVRPSRNTAPSVRAAAGEAAAPGEDKHAVIVGAGIVGAFLARSLLDIPGWKVTVLEAREEAGQVATYCSWAWINANRKQPVHYRDLTVAAMAEWEKFDMVDFCGCLIVDDPFPPNPDYPADDVAQGDLRAEEPALGEEFVARSKGARLFRQEGLTEPVQCVEECLAHVRGRGGRVLFSEGVKDLVVEGGEVRGVRTSKGEHHADVVVLASGVDIPALMGKVSASMPLLDRPGILVHTTPLERSLLKHIVVSNTCYMLQRPGGGLVIGEDMNGAGQEDPCDTSLENGRRVLRKAAEVVPALLGADVAEVTLGRRPYPADGLPVVGEVPGVPGLYVSVMHSGVTLAPLMGRLAAEEIAGLGASEWLAPYRPARASLADAGEEAAPYDLQYDGASAGKPQ